MYDQTFEDDYKMPDDKIMVERVDPTPNSKRVHKVVMKDRPDRQFSAGTIRVDKSHEIEKG